LVLGFRTTGNLLSGEVISGYGCFPDHGRAVGGRCGAGKSNPIAPLSCPSNKTLSLLANRQRCGERDGLKPPFEAHVCAREVLAKVEVCEGS